MNIRVDGKVALVTGGGTGIGKAIALELAQSGASVVVHYHASEQAAMDVMEQITASGGKAIAVQADVTNKEQVQCLVQTSIEHFGRIDILVNNAGDMIQRCAIVDMPEDLWDAIMALNVKGVFLVTQAVLPMMVRQGSGNIVNISSIAARSGGGGHSVAYATAKGAVSTFTRGLAKEVVKQGIRVNAVAPGATLTRFQERHSTPEKIAQFTKETPVGRCGLAEDMVGAVLYLVSDYASFVVGETIDVNGGRFMS
ncbi:glucose 1-dehydrogenase [candidate division KSB3 bacterium]|uniref:Glucose 1-dehydrogenase n=1 Tax=candidate division KSB3 bacterium TaxID=2044937 RepID=A0A9D5JTW8_9BACT|nr:glucose 1-dehydrogenase [candidate division KSB3 bacterium]MBD3324159.1 glucose 1-dehydrogenase [candidate division KSB3 bacterium]